MSTIGTTDLRSTMHRHAGGNWLTALLHLLRRVETMLERSRSRRLLYGLNDEQLKDIGLSRSEAYREASRRFWQ